MPPLGAGACPAGSAAAGYGVPDKGTTPNDAVLPDKTTGLPTTGRYLDPTTKAYTFTSDGRIQGTPTSRQLVQLALRTTLGSAADPVLGLGSAGLDKGPDYQRALAAAISRALARLVGSGLITINSVTVQDYDNPDGTAALVQWTDNSSGVQFTDRITGP